MKERLFRLYPHLFVSAAHMGGLLLSVWMKRWDLFIAGILFGIPSSFLFFDLLPGGRGYTIRFVKGILRL